MATRSGGKYRAWVRPFRHWWKPLTWIWGALILSIIINDGSSWLITKNFDISGTPLGWGVDHPWITLPPLSLLVLLTLLAGLGVFQEDVATVSAASLTLMPKQRLQLIRGLQQEYIRRWTSSLQGKVALELRFQERNDVVASSANLVFRHQETSEASPLPSGTSIIQVYDTAERGLLILGGPGSGKTTLLLELVRELLQRAENDPDQPIAIILNLSTWASTRSPLTQWLGEQCSLVCGISKQLSAAWIAQEQVQFLLDGLDEMEAPARTACIEAINIYRQAHVVPLIVCSRSQEYLLQPTQVILPVAVEIQPLEPAQVLQVLKRAGKSLAAVRAALHSNAVLNTLLTTPLMLSIVLLTYRDKTAKDLPQMGPPEEQQRQIFTHYVQRMLQRHEQRRTFSLAQTSSSLAWLAQQMQQRHLTEFYLERMQPTWLAMKRMRTIFFLLDELLNGLLLGLECGLAIGLAFGPELGLFFGLIVGIGFSEIGMLLGIFTGWWGKPSIQPADVLTWTWSWQNFWISVLSGAIVFGAIGGNRGQLDHVLPAAMIGGGGGALFALLRGLLTGFATQINEQVRTKPNEGILHSGRHALRIILISICTFVLVGALLGGIFGWYTVGLINGLLIGLRVGTGAGLGFGLFYGLDRGGNAYLEHYLLRVFLLQNNTLPWHAVCLLDEACTCILLQRVGGGYRFIHPLFQEYFASLTTSPASKKSIVVP